MVAYFILFFLITMLLFIGALKPEVKIYTFFFSVLLLSLFSGFAKGVGLDYENYANLFKEINLHYSVPLEIGYIAIIKAIILIGGKYQILVLFSALATNFLLGFYIYRNSPSPNFSLFIYLTVSIFYLATFTTIRQFIAVGIFSFSIKYIEKRRFLPYTILILLGSTIHSTLLVFLPLYFVLNRKFKFWHYLLFTAIWVLLIKLVELLFKDLLGFSELYFGKEEVTSNSMILIGFVLMGVLFLSLKNNLIQFDPRSKIYLNLIFLSVLVILTVYLSDIHTEIVLRMSSYFTIAYLIMIPIFFLNIKHKSIRYLCLIALLCLFITYFFYVTAINGLRYKLIPYDFNLKLF